MMAVYTSTHCTVKLILLLLTFFMNLIGRVESLSDVTSSVFGTIPSGIVAAFGDFDANKVTDIFTLSSDGRSLILYEADLDIRKDQVEFTKKSFYEGKDSDARITSVVPGDFKYDAQMDFMVTRKVDDSSTKTKVEVFDGKKIKADPYLVLNETLRDQPIVVDANGDMIPDLFGETESGQRAYWIFDKKGMYTLHPITNGSGKALPPLRSPHSSAFLDLNADLTADLCAVSVKDGAVLFEFWLNEKGTLTWNKNVFAPKDLKVVGQASFGDFNGNHELNIILPGCLDDDCKESAVFVWSENKYLPNEHGKWYRLDINFETDSKTKLTFPKTTSVTDWLTLPIVLRIGDFNLDGYPDAVTVLKNEDGDLNAYLMHNTECSGSHCEGFSRTLKIHNALATKGATPSIVTFFDLKENGVLDFVLTETKSDGRVAIRAIEQQFSGDASFLKVVVVSGLCNENCPSGNSPYGVNQVGPVVKFESTTPTGGDQIGMASQLSQSSYFSLQLPFVLFGLGQTPNFVDQLKVGIPNPPGKSPRTHSWMTLIPNSQIIVIPYPVSEPSGWQHELYVTPSRLVLLTGVSLLGTCAFIALIVGLLHWRERREDKKEKLQESQRFHFDAM